MPRGPVKTSVKFQFNLLSSLQSWSKQLVEFCPSSTKRTIAKSFNSMTSRVLNSTRANVETNWPQTTECWASATKKRCLKFTQTWRIFHLFAAVIWLAVAATVLARATVWQCVTSSWEKQNSSEFHEKIVFKSPLGLKDDDDQRQVIHRVSGRFRSITT